MALMKKSKEENGNSIRRSGSFKKTRSHSRSFSGNGKKDDELHLKSKEVARTPGKSRKSSFSTPQISSVTAATSDSKQEYDTHKNAMKQEQVDQTLISAAEPPSSPNSPPAQEPVQSPEVPEAQSAPAQTDSKTAVKSDSNGFLSSILTAANNIMNSTMDETDEKEEKMLSPKILHDDQSSSNSADKRDSGFSHKLEFLLRPAKLNSKGTVSDLDGEGKSQHSEEPEHKEATPPNDLSHPASNVQFESVRESPLNTLGRGDLSLDLFESTRKGRLHESPSTSAVSGLGLPSGTISPGADRGESIHRKLTSTPRGSTDNIHDLRKSISTERAGGRSLPPSAQLVASGNGDSKKVHRKSFSNGTPLEEVISKSSARSRNPEDSDSDSDAEPESEGEDLDPDVDFSNVKFASKKRNAEFHNIFRNLPKSERLISDCSCALSKDILVQGRMYISEHYICFKSNILGWVTNLTIPFQEVILIEKKSTAVLFPNGMIIRTLHHKYVFATFLTRDATFDFITDVWHKVLLENSDIDPGKLEGFRRSRGRSKSSGQSKSVGRGSSDSSDLDSDDSDFIHLDDVIEDENGESTADSGEVDEDATGEEDDGSLSGIALKRHQKNKKAGMNNGSNGDSLDEGNSADDAGASKVESKIARQGSKNGESDGGEGGANFKGFPVVGPLTHSPTETDYTKQPNDTFICEEVISAPVGAVFGMLFGDDISPYVSILKKQKNFDITESDIKGLGAKTKVRNYSYIKPLSGPIGPKQTKCLIEDKLVEFSPEKFILVEQITSTPDVPSGNSFKVCTKLYLSWANNNSTKLYCVTSVEWSGKSWIKGAIEKGSIEGQKESMKLMVEALHDMAANGNTSSKVKSKGKKKSRPRRNTASKSKTTEEKKEKPKEPEPQSVQQQLSGLIESVGKLLPIPFLSDFLTGTIVSVIVLLLFVKLVNLITPSGGSGTNIQYLNSQGYSSSRIKINGQKYLVIPTVDAGLDNTDQRMDAEVSLWNWVRKRSDDQLNIDIEDRDSVKQKYSEQEMREIVKITQLKLDKLNEKFGL